MQREAVNQNANGAAVSPSSIPAIQRKLSIGASNDPLEQEADRVADQVMAASTHSAVSNAPPRIQRFAGQAAVGVNTVPASVDHVLASSGRPLEPALRQDMELRFGYDFSQVRVHSGAAAEQSAREVSANAYTAGHNIVFGAGRFAPLTPEGRRLVAHELTHVVQQSGSDGIHVNQGGERRSLFSNIPNTALESRPDVHSEKMLADSKTGIHISSNGAQLQRQPIFPVIPQTVVIGTEKFPPATGLNHDDLERKILSLIEIWRANELARIQIDLLLPQYLSEVDKKLQPKLPGIGISLGFRIYVRQEEKDASYPPIVRDRLIRLPIEQQKSASVKLDAKSTPRGHIGQQWKAQRSEFLAAAADPANLLSGGQHFQIWYQYWIEQHNAAVDEVKRVTTVVRQGGAQAIIDYANNLELFRKGKRGALGPEYEQAVNRMETTDY